MSMNENAGDGAMFEKKKLLVLGLNQITKEKGLRNYFQKFGIVHFVKTKYKRKAKFAFVSFKDNSSLDVVLNAGIHFIDGNQVYPQKIKKKKAYPKFVVGGFKPEVTYEGDTNVRPQGVPPPGILPPDIPLSGISVPGIPPYGFPSTSVPATGVLPLQVLHRSVPPSLTPIVPHTRLSPSEVTAQCVPPPKVIPSGLPSTSVPAPDVPFLSNAPLQSPPNHGLGVPYRRSRSRSKDEIYRREQSRIAYSLCTESDNLECGRVIKKRVYSRSPSSRKESNKRQRYGDIEIAPNEVSNVTMSQNSNSDNIVMKNPSEFSVVEACQFLMNFCDMIGILGHSLKVALEETLKCGNDTFKILKSLNDLQSQDLLVLVANKFNRMQETTQDSILKAKYIQASIAAKFLMESTKLCWEKSKSGFHKQPGSSISTAESLVKNFGGRENELFSNTASNSTSTIINLLDEVGESFDLKLPQRNHEWDSSKSALNSSSTITNILDEVGKSMGLKIDLKLPQRNHECDSSKSASNSTSTITNLLHEVGEPMYLKLPQQNHEWDSLKYASNSSSSITKLLDEVGESIDLKLPQKNHEWDSKNVHTLNDRNFKVAIFGHEYVSRLPFYTGDTFNSQIPDNPYQVIKYAKYGAKIMEVQEYSIWNEVISAQPHMIFLILGKHDISFSKFVSPEDLADRMLTIKSELEKHIFNVKIVCFGLEKKDSDERWSSYQDTLNCCLGAGFDTLIFPTLHVDISNESYEASLKVWNHIQVRIQKTLKDMQSSGWTSTHR
ncbi:unnamed protein product [Meganyctiphanes norvegica]|uniref:RRM domain-containing protein n=1 Tax=Meganyctiphanes norvegica TaxID=48144 RepID=A0AAV2SK97_MEGNR